MIYVTGDLHGDLKRFKDKGIKKLKKNDYLIVCGDFGFIWSGTKKEKEYLKNLAKRNITFFLLRAVMKTMTYYTIIRLRNGMAAL